MGQFIFNVIFYGFIASCLIRHFINTISTIQDFFYKAKNRRSERFKH